MTSEIENPERCGGDGYCIYVGGMCDDCREDQSQHIYRLLCGWCAEPLAELDAMYCSQQCGREDQKAMDLHAREEDRMRRLEGRR